MKKMIFVVLTLFPVSGTYAQVNLVLNPSFELYDTCPFSLDQIHYAKYWNSIDTLYYPVDSLGLYGTCAAEYCNACDSTSPYGVPRGYSYFQYPRTGNGMAQMVICDVDHNDGLEQRDYTQGRLYESLVAGKQYCVTFFVNKEKYCAYAVNNIGAYLDDGSIDTAGYYCGRPQTEYTPQALTDSIISDTMYWTKVQGTFTANGMERFITIGNFFDNPHTDTLRIPGYWVTYTSVYLLDDVSVIPSDNIPFAGNDTSIVKGDSAFLGPHEIALPYTWYRLGDTMAIDSGGGMWVHPDSTTTYVLAQNLCGKYTYDTVTVSVHPLGISPLNPINGVVSVYPNPAHDVVTVQYSGLQQAAFEISDVAGRVLLRQPLPGQSGTVPVAIGKLVAGIYEYRVVQDGVAAFGVGKLVKD
jgi:hypothetical protein